MITKYQPSSQKKLSVFLEGPPDTPCSLSFTRGGTFFEKCKNIDIFKHIFLTSTPISIEIETGCKYFTLFEPFDA